MAMSPKIKFYIRERPGQEYEYCFQLLSGRKKKSAYNEL